MLVEVRVIPRSREQCVLDGNPLVVKVKSPPEGGKANSELIKLLAKHFSVPASKIKIIKGKKSKRKVVEVTGL